MKTKILVLFLAVMGASYLGETVVLLFANRGPATGTERIGNLERQLESGEPVKLMFPPSAMGSLLQPGEIHPLSSAAGQEIELCFESKHGLIIKHDEFGFNNPSGSHEVKGMDVALIGDSFAQGACVPLEKNLASVLRYSGLKSISLGLSGNGPLIELATLREYGRPLEPSHVVWMFYEGNDFYGLEKELDQPILKQYLESGFSQNLRSQQDEIDRLQPLLLNRSMKATRERLIERGYRDPDHWLENPIAKFLRLKATRNFAKRTVNASKNNKHHARLRHHKQKQIQTEVWKPALEEILMLAKLEVEGWGGKLTFCYLPTWDRYFEAEMFGDAWPKAEVIAIAQNLSLEVLDLSEQTVPSIGADAFFHHKQYCHYSEEGYQRIGEEILKQIKSMDGK